MGVSLYNPSGIVHTTSVDFSKRNINSPIHIVQYDETLPTLAVSLYNNGQLFPLTDSMEVNIRLGKPDKTFVYKSALGCNANRTVAYFEIIKQMTVISGEYYPVIEIVDGNKVACSSSIHIIVDRNPIQQDYVESTTEFVQLVEYRDQAKHYAEQASGVSVDVSKYLNEAKAAANSASASASSSATSASSAATSAANAHQSELNIAGAEESCLNSANAALESQNKAKESEDNAKISEDNAKASEESALAHAVAAGKSEDNAKISEDNAKASEESAESQANLAKSYAVGTNNTVRENDSEDNAKKYAESARTESKKCKEYAENMESAIAVIDKQTKATKFEVDFATGELIQTTDNAFIFSINETSGNLEWEVSD